MEHPDEERFKLWPTTLNRKIFQDIILSGSKEEVEKRYPIVRLYRKRKPEPRNRLVDAYVFFSIKIEQWLDVISASSVISRQDAAFKLLQALQQDFSVVEISLSEGDDPQEIFYSLNSQGRPCPNLTCFAV